jgi:ABC-type nitrate/sulfonate/bicarbonate transport system permease component
MSDPHLPGPLKIGRTIIADLNTPGPEGESAFFDIGITLARIFIAFFASTVAGIGLAMGLNRFCERSLRVLIPLMLTMPTILVLPRYHMVWLRRSRQLGRRHGGGHALCRREYVRRPQSNGQVLARHGGDV